MFRELVTSCFQYAALVAVIGCGEGASAVIRHFDALPPAADAATDVTAIETVDAATDDEATDVTDADEDATNDDAATNDAPDDGRTPGFSTGTVKGKDLNVADGVTNNLRTSGFGFIGPAAVIALPDLAGICAREATNSGAKNRRLLAIVLGVNDAAGQSSPPTQPGTFAVVPNSSAALPPNASLAQASFEETDALCFYNTVASATGGSVELTSIDPQTGTLEGTFMLQFPDGDVLGGGFRATRCPALNPNRTPLMNCR